jgi:hypothetical protein
MVCDDLYGLNIRVSLSNRDRRNRELDSRYPIDPVLQLRCLQRFEFGEIAKVINVVCSVPVSYI